MKKTIFVLLIAVLLSSCQQVFNFVEDVNLSDQASGHTLYHLPEFDTLDTHAKISIWIRNHIKFDYTYSDVDVWANPEDTINSGLGTCGDFAVLYLNIAYFGMGLKGELVCGTLVSSRSISDGGDANHAQVRFGDMVIEPQSGRISTMSVGYYYSFDEVF